MSEHPTKRCKKCERVLPATREYYHAHPHCKHGVKTICKECIRKPIVISPDLPGEVWKVIPKWNGHYEASNKGRIRSTKRRTNSYPGRVLKPTIDKYGYKKLSLSSGGYTKTCSVHSLVAETFHGERPEGLVVNHIDGVKTNNNVENLEWVTHRENLIHSYEVLGRPYGRPPTHIGEKHPQSRLTVKQVLATRILYESGVFSAQDIADFWKVSKQSIQNIVNRKTWKDAA